MAAIEQAVTADEAVVALGRARAAFRDDEETARTELHTGLGRAEGVDVFADHLAGQPTADAAEFADWVTAQDRGEAAGLLMRARLAESGGDVDEAERLATASALADIAFLPARWDAAWHAVVRDHYGDALYWLGSIDVDDADPDLAHWTLAGLWRAGRLSGAAPCACGSGRHLKRCCGRDGVELRLAWWKLRAFLFRTPQRAVTVAVAGALAGVDTTGSAGLSDGEAGRLARALASPLTESLTLSAGGCARRYFEQWGERVSPAEARLLELIGDARLDVWVVGADRRSLRSLDGRTTMRPRNPATLSDLPTGDGCVVAAVTGDGRRHDCYVLGDPVPLRAAPVEGPPIEVAEALRRGTDPVALARTLAGFVT